MREHDVIVVGAGLSGLSAAKVLRQRGMKVVVLEATERVGGRMHTLTPVKGEPNYGWADLGAAFVGSSQKNVLRMCKELGLTTYKCSEELDGIHYSKGKRHIYEGVRPKLWNCNPLAAWDLAVMERRVEKMYWEIPVDKPWEAPHAKEWDQMTVKQFYNKHCWTKFCKEYLTAPSTIESSTESGYMSLLFYLWDMRQAKGVNQSVGGEEEPEWMKIVGGTQQIAEKLAQKMGSSVILGKPVVLIKHTDADVMVQTLDGTEYKAKFIIISTPPVTQMKIKFEPALPLKRYNLMQRSPMGLLMKCVVFYKEPFWEQNGFNGFVDCSDDVEVVGLATDDQKPGSKLFGLFCFVFKKQMVKLLGMSDKMKQDSVCRSLAKFYNSEEFMNPVKFLYKVWPEDESFSGGYSTCYPPGALTLFGPAMRAPIGPRVFLAGTETATQWVGYMSGAIDAGERAAREVLHAAGCIEKSEIWIKEPWSTYQPKCNKSFIPSIDAVVNVSGWLALVLGLTWMICLLN